MQSPKNKRETNPFCLKKVYSTRLELRFVRRGQPTSYGMNQKRFGTTSAHLPISSSHLTKDLNTRQKLTHPGLITFINIKV